MPEEKKSASQQELLPHLFRTEYTKIIAVLCRHFGLKQIEIAEDIASDTFLKAHEHWGINGIPENPAAWLYTVAKNKTKDYFKHLGVFEKKVKEAIKPAPFVPEFEFNDQIISDSQLAMIFAVCNPANSTSIQISLSLQILCGFSVEEIANALLTKAETIKKRLQRGRANLRNNNFQINELSEGDITSRLETVTKTIYLVFNEGYFSKTNDQIIRKDLCSEAIRLALVLSENLLTNTPRINALLALMCFQSSRLDARTDDKGQIVLFEDQDKTLWDQTLIARGNHYLINACEGSDISKYHLEAAIAYWHTTPTDENKWQHILQLYNQLILIEYSPITALNRAFAIARVFGPDKAIPEVEKLHLTESNHYHGLLGYLYAETDVKKAIRHYEKAVGLTKAKREKEVLMKEIKRLSDIECILDL